MDFFVGGSECSLKIGSSLSKFQMTILLFSPPQLNVHFESRFWVGIDLA